MSGVELPEASSTRDAVLDLFRTSSAALFLTDAANRVVAASPAAERLFHYPRGGADGLLLSAFGPLVEAAPRATAVSSPVVQCRTREGEPFRSRLRVLEIREGDEPRRAWILEPLARNAPALHERYQSTLLRISRAPEFAGGDFPAAARRLVREVTEVMEVERVSVWLLSEDGERLECVALHERGPDRVSSGTVLAAQDFPRYFEALAEGRAIDAGDAARDPRTSEFATGYLDALGIGSLLDSVIRVAGEVVGVVCHEHVGAPRDWREEEVVFSAEVADQAAQALLESRRQRAEDQSRRLERELAQAHKLEAIGRLASGVAHDFNNLLTIIRGYTDLGETTAQNAETVDSLQEIRRAAERAGSLTQQLLAIGRRQVLRPQPVDLNETVLSMQGMLRRLIPEDIALEFNAHAEHASVIADVRQLEQVLINLCINARDATHTGGTIQVETRNSASAGEEAVLLSVQDDGEGIPFELQEEIFDPFFTSKAEGKGTGLGLSMIYGIAKQHGGDVSVKSAPGAGSRFEVRLPVLDESQSATSTTANEVHNAAASASSRSSGRILLAEDAEPLRRLVRRMLEAEGFEVLEARDGEEAVERFRAAAGTIDLVVLDAIMPRLGGQAALAAIRALEPNVRCVLTTGYGDGVLDGSGTDDPPAVVSKPFDADDFLAVVRAELARPR